MRTSKKVLLSAVSLLGCLAILSTAIICPWSVMEGSYFSDRSLRRDLAGSIDMIVLGASHALAAFDPNILDESLGCTSYNLSGSLMSSYSKQYLLDKELARNPVKTVVLEISYDSLYREQEYGDGDSVTIERLDSIPERLSFLTKYVSIDGWLNVFSWTLIDGLSFWKDIIRGNPKSGVDRASKGFKSKKEVDITIMPEQALSLYCTDSINTNYKESEVRALRTLIESCHSKGVDVIIAVTPLSNRMLWRESGWDDFRLQLKSISENNGCAYYDFNLLKTRYDLFDDSYSFYDETHMSQSGAEAFSFAFADVLKRAENGEDVSELFYNSYAQAIEDSPYMKYNPSAK